MNQRITVDVTQADIDAALVGLPTHTDLSFGEICPIAKAVKRLYPGSHVSVGCIYVYVDYKAYKATSQYEGVIQDFANHRRYRPTTFEITRVNQVED